MDSGERLRALEKRVTELAGDLRVLRKLLVDDSQSALNKMRYVTEKVLHRLCREHDVSWGKGEPTVENMIGPLIAAKVIPKNVGLHVRTVQTNASPGSHFQEHALGSTHVQVAQLALVEVLEWYQRRSEGAAAAEEPASSQEGPQVSSPPASMVRVTRRRRAPLAVIVVAALAGVAATTAFLLRGPSDSLSQAVATPPSASAKAAHTPDMGLAAIDLYRNPVGPEASKLTSATWWEAVARDFEAAATDASPRWLAAQRFAAGRAHLLKSELVEAEASFREAVKADESWSLGHGGLADALARRGQFDDAIAAAEEAQRREPNWPGALVGLAHVLAAAGKMPEAIDEYRRAIALGRDDAAILSELALAYGAARLDAESERFARLALEKDPDALSARVLLAERALERNDMMAALDEAERAVAVGPQSLAAQLAFADALALAADRREEAMAAYQRAVVIADTVEGASGPAGRLDVVRKALAAKRLPEPRVPAQRTGAPPAPRPIVPRTTSCPPGHPRCSVQL
jgi:tetratricopeptide (TPR) repeat protein